MMDEAVAAHRPLCMQRLFERIEDKAGMRCPAHSPADDAPSVGVNDEGDIDEAGSTRACRVKRTSVRNSAELPSAVRTGAIPTALLNVYSANHGERSANPRRAAALRELLKSLVGGDFQRQIYSRRVPM
jgi:hypothetical protein